MFRVGVLSGLLADRVGLPAIEVERISRGASLHDVGKIAIADAILLKPGSLKFNEFNTMKTHAGIGARDLSGSKSRLIQLAEQIALTHHERWDGAGYPAQLKGEDIPIAGRIVALAGVFDALTQKRTYKNAWPLDEAIAEITRLSGSHLDPAVVAAFSTLDEHKLQRLVDQIGQLAHVA